MRYDTGTGGISQERGETNHTNGLAYDAQGRLFGCCSAGRSIVRFDAGDTTIDLWARWPLRIRVNMSPRGSLIDMAYLPLPARLHHARDLARRGQLP